MLIRSVMTLFIGVPLVFGIACYLIFFLCGSIQIALENLEKKGTTTFALRLLIGVVIGLLLIANRIDLAYFGWLVTTITEFFYGRYFYEME